MMSRALIPIFLVVLMYVSAQDTSSTSAPTSTTVSSTTTNNSSTESSSTTTASSTSTGSSTTASGPTTPTINTCHKHGRFPATNEKCTQEYIVCIPNFKGGFWQHKWKCAGSLVFNDRFKKCTSPRKADCLNTTTTSTTTNTSPSSTDYSSSTDSSSTTTSQSSST